MEQQAWVEIAKDVLIPVAAIVVSTLVAVWLARSERQSSERARREERALAETERQRERLEIAAARALDAVGSIEVYAQDTDRCNDLVGPMRVSLTLLGNVLITTRRENTRWISLERLDGMLLIGSAHSVWEVSDDEGEYEVAPPHEQEATAVRQWATELAGVITLLMRGGPGLKSAEQRIDQRLEELIQKYEPDRGRLPLNRG